MNDAHYIKASMQPIQFLQMFLSKEAFIGFLIGNAVKYKARRNYKGSFEADTTKMRTYAYWKYLVETKDKIIDPIKDIPSDDWEMPPLLN